jgi:hypothetical protein
VTIAVSAALACAAATGCGGDDGPDRKAIQDGVRTTIERGPLRVSFRGTVRVGDGRTLTFRGGGHDHPAKRSFELTTASGDFAQAVPGTSAPDFDTKIVKLGAVYHVSSPRIGKRGQWLRLDISEFTEGDAAAARVLAQSHQSTSAQILDYAAAAETDEEVGQERVGGVETTRYRGTVHIAEVARHVPAAERAAVADNAATLRTATGKATMPIEVWLDRDGLMRRGRLSYTLVRGPVSGGAFRATLTLEGHFSEHGRPVDIRAPRGEMLTLDDLAKRAPE